MKNLKDVLKVISGRINSNELSAAISASNPFEVEFDDNTFSEIEGYIKGLTTFEEAKNNPEIFNAIKPKIERQLDKELEKKYKAETLSRAEQDLGKIAKKVGIDIEGKRWADLVSDFANKADSMTGNVDERLQHANSEIEKLHKKIGNLQEARNKEKEDFTKQMTTYQVDSILKAEIENSIPLAKPYQEKVVKEGLINRFMTLAKDKSEIRLENGSLKFMNKENPELELYSDKSTKSGLLDLIGQEAQPYVATEPNKPQSPGFKREEVRPETSWGVPGSPADAMRRQRMALNDSV